MASALRLVSVVSLLTYAAQCFEWTPPSLRPGSNITVCNGQHTVNLYWGYVYADSDGPLNIQSEHDDDDIVWTFKPNLYSNESILARSHQGHFIPEPNIHQRLTFIPRAGLRISGLTAQDSGVYTMKVTVNEHGYFTAHENNVTLHVADSFAVSNNELRVIKLSHVSYELDEHEFRVQLSCGTFTYLGTPPVSVFFTTPDHRVLTDTTYENGHFTVTLPNPVVTGDYTCQIANPQDTCRSSSPSFLAPATVHVSGYNAQFDVLNAELVAHKQEIQRLRSEVDTLDWQLGAQRLALEQCTSTQQLSSHTQHGPQYHVTAANNLPTCSYGRSCDYSQRHYETTTSYLGHYHNTVFSYNWTQHTHELEVRLVDGPNCTAGRVEVRVLGCNEWGRICSDGWGAMEADVLCRQLGYSVWNSNDYFGAGSGPVVLSHVKCHGSEDNLGQCNVTYGAQEGLHCHDTGVTCFDAER